MPKMKIRKLVAYKDYTHTLRIPIVTVISRPQLHVSFARFEQGTSTIVPEGSIIQPDTLSCQVGRLDLKTPERLDSFS